MSHSYGDHRGKHINHEIGRFVKLVGDQIILDYGWEPTGSPLRKRYAKRTFHRMLRRASKNAIKSQMED